MTTPPDFDDANLQLPDAHLSTRLFRLGAEVLSDAELLALLLGRRAAVNSVVENLAVLARLDPLELADHPKIGVKGAARLAAALELARRVHANAEGMPVFRTPADIGAWAQRDQAWLRRETMRVLCLNARGRLLRDVIVAVGGADRCVLDAREVFAPAIAVRASAIVLVHNHPGGNPEPSSDDVAVTRAIAEAGALLGVRLLDHLVVARGGVVSLAARGLLPEGAAARLQ